MAGPQSWTWLILLSIVLIAIVLSIGVVFWAVRRWRRDRERVQGFEVQPAEQVNRL